MRIANAVGNLVQVQIMTMIRRVSICPAFPVTMRRCLSTAAKLDADYTHVVCITSTITSPVYCLSNQVVGAGVVGLAIARRLAQKEGTSTLLLERRGSVGSETSSRNSEVIHAGIYYGPDSFKTSLCIKGKHMLYDLCEKESIPYRNTKKWILAQDDHQHQELQRTHDFAKSIDVPINFLPLSEAKKREPDVRAEAAVLESPTTGIVDSHAYMSFLESNFVSLGGDLACHTSVESVEPVNAGNGGWRVETRSGSEEELTTITAETLINSAGLAAMDLSNSILPQSRKVKPYYAKGSYYSYTAPHPKPQTLLYPAPMKGAGGLGTHLTIDMAGQIRFGPDVEWVDDPNDLAVNDRGLGAALAAIETYLPGIRKDKVQMDYSGIRPKLGKRSAGANHGRDSGFLDFIIRNEEGFEGFINLLGIESPGLTSSLAIGDMVHDLLYRGAVSP